MQEPPLSRLSSPKSHSRASAPSRTTQISLATLLFLSARSVSASSSPLVFDQQDVSLPHSVPPEARVK